MICSFAAGRQRQAGQHERQAGVARRARWHAAGIGAGRWRARPGPACRWVGRVTLGSSAGLRGRVLAGWPPPQAIIPRSIPPQAKGRLFPTTPTTPGPIGPASAQRDERQSHPAQLAPDARAGRDRARLLKPQAGSRPPSARPPLYSVRRAPSSACAARARPDTLLAPTCRHIIAIARARAQARKLAAAICRGRSRTSCGTWTA